ncbi:MAG: Fic family protein [Oscillospiraceae bacterium]|jgi:Fic family protein|nr:Fic family protein [Oscillospiraceae bacterium]
MTRKYIYENSNWREMQYNESALHSLLIQLYKTQSKLFGKLDALGFEVQNDLLLSSVSDEVVTSSEIEGETLNRSSVRSSVAKRLGLETAGIEDIPENYYTEGVVEIALDATQNFASTLDEERLFGWHSALFPTGRSGIRRIHTGGYRKGDIEIVSGVMGKEKIHYKAPAPELVKEEMKIFLNWLEANQNIDLYIKAGLAHLWFELIHPFDDGNGRIGRAIADLMLARAENTSKRYYSLSSQILKERKEYYKVLEMVSSYTNDVESWLIWFLGCLERAIDASGEKIDKAKYKAVIYEQLRKTPLNTRQSKMLNMLIDDFEGKLTTSKWAKICKCSHDTALRDIDDLIKKGIISRSPKGGRSTAYELI